MKLLPHWCLTNTKPGFYDTDSGTAIEQTAKVYRVMNELITEYNTFVDNINTKIEEFNSGVIAANDGFRVALRQEFQDFINVVDLKILQMDQSLKSNIESIREGIITYSQQVVNEILKNGEVNVTTTYNEANESLNISFVIN